MIDYAFLWGAFLGLFAIMNPFSTALIFLSITKGDSEAKKKEMAHRAVVISAFVLVFFMITGSFIFSLFSITLEAFKIAGGLLIAITGYHMLKVRDRTTEEEQAEAAKQEDVSIIPLAIPMLAGPGAITAALVWTSNSPGVTEHVLLLFIPVIICALSYFILTKAKHLKKVLRTTGTNVLERLMGLIVLVMGIQFILNAIYDIVPNIIGMI